MRDKVGSYVERTLQGQLRPARTTGGAAASSATSATPWGTWRKLAEWMFLVLHNYQLLSEDEKPRVDLMNMLRAAQHLVKFVLDYAGQLCALRSLMPQPVDVLRDMRRLHRFPPCLHTRHQNVWLLREMREGGNAHGPVQ